jgi:hypothetical protein
MNPMKKGRRLAGKTPAGHQPRRPKKVLYVGLDLSRKRLDWQPLGADGDLIGEGACPPDRDALAHLARRFEGIRAYNEEDCRSTVALHEWLLGLRPAGLPWQLPPEEREQSEEAEERDATRIALHEALLADGGGGHPQLAPRASPHRRASFRCGNQSSA